MKQIKLTVKMEEKKKREGENVKEYQERMNYNILKYKDELSK